MTNTSAQFPSIALKLLLQNRMPSDTFDIVVSESPVELVEMAKLDIFIILP